MSKNKFTASLILVISLFFMWGFITVLNDVLISYFKTRYTLTEFESTLVQLFFFGAYGIGATVYLIISSIGEDPINKIGYKNGIFLGAVAAGLGCILFYPFMMVESYYINLIPLIILGLGLTLLQIACNPFVILLGDEKNGDIRLNLAQGLNSLGTALSPVIGGYFIFVYFEGIAAVQIPFLVAGLIFIGIGFIIKQSSFPVFINSASIEKGNLWRFNHLKFGAIAVFLYVGAEVAIGSKFIDLIEGNDGLDISKFDASMLLGYYWGGAMVGRLMMPLLANAKTFTTKITQSLLLIFVAYLLLSFSITIGSYFNNNQTFSLFNIFYLNLLKNYPFLIGALIVLLLSLKFFGSTKKMVMIFSGVNIILLIIGFVNFQMLGVWSIVLVGLFNSIMWSNIFVLSTANLGNYKSKASSLLIIMIVGGAFFPLLMGSIADSFNLRIAYLLPIISYLYILFYARYTGNIHE